MPRTCRYQVVRIDRPVTDCADVGEALDYITEHSMLDSDTYVRIITNGEFQRDFWWGDFTRPEDYIKPAI